MLKVFRVDPKKELYGPSTPEALSMEFSPDSRWLALGVALISAVLLQALHAIVSIKFKADQIISGTVINILALGITGYFYRQFLAQNLPAGPGTFPIVKIPFLSEIPVIGPILFQQQPITYMMLILVFVIQYVLFFTPWGLRTRSVGEHPRAADTLGIRELRFLDYIDGEVDQANPAEAAAQYHDVLPTRSNCAGLFLMLALVHHSGDHPCNRSNKWSPTRKALAIIVSEGFIALLETKKLASTT